MNKLLDYLAIGIVGSVLLGFLGLFVWMMITTYHEHPTETINGLINCTFLFSLMWAFSRVEDVLKKRQKG